MPFPYFCVFVCFVRFFMKIIENEMKTSCFGVHVSFTFDPIWIENARVTRTIVLPAVKKRTFLPDPILSENRRFLSTSRRIPTKPARSSQNFDRTGFILWFLRSANRFCEYLTGCGQRDEKNSSNRKRKGGMPSVLIMASPICSRVISTSSTTVVSRICSTSPLDVILDRKLAERRFIP